MKMIVTLFVGELHMSNQLTSSKFAI